MSHTHQTAPTQFVEANGIRFAYRRFGKPGGAPLVFNQHFRGAMDYWDPAVTDGLAKNREVILFDNAGLRGLRWVTVTVYLTPFLGGGRMALHASHRPSQGLR
jgi:pimeloyl-ACP methyl ester carboxylesterase